ncbi:hypothetical protein SynRS9909_02386 [Synechococcus sp. RS9909]|nr:hypothetical protein SynRS9909_02386 [Synechococcus sp. RS9909]
MSKGQSAVALGPERHWHQRHQAKKTGGTGADQSRSCHGFNLAWWFRPRPDEVMTDL